MMQLSLVSRTTSISYSFQPSSDSSISSSRVGDRSSPRRQISSNSSLVVRNAAARAAQRERRTDHDRIAAAAGLRGDIGLHLQRFFHRMRDARLGRTEADLRHRVLELLAVFGLVDRFRRRADQLDLVLLQHAVMEQIERAIERGLAAHRRQDRVRALLRDDALDHFPRDRLDVGDVGRVRVGHDRRRIAVDENDLVAFLTQRLARLRARIIELARLADDDRTRADDEDALDVCPLRHNALANVFLNSSVGALLRCARFRRSARRALRIACEPCARLCGHQLLT